MEFSQEELREDKLIFSIFSYLAREIILIGEENSLNIVSSETTCGIFFIMPDRMILKEEIAASKLCASRSV